MIHSSCPACNGIYNYVATCKGHCSFLSKKDSFRWFERFLLEGKVIEELRDLPPLLNDSSSIFTSRDTAAKVVVVASARADAGVDNGSALRKRCLAEIDELFLFRELKHERVIGEKECA